MKNSKIAILGIAVLLTSFIYLAPPVLAVSAEEHNFVILGRIIEEEDGTTRIRDELVNLLLQPGIADVRAGQLKSGTVVLVLQKIELQTGEIYYQVSTFGRGGGMIGWVTEEYIYEILPGPPQQ